MAVSYYQQHRPREATATVSLAPDYSGDFICSGAVDDVEINAAVAFIVALGGGKLYLGPGIFNLTVTVDLTVSMIFEGSGFDAASGTSLRTNVAIDVITVTANNCIIRSLHVDGRGFAPPTGGIHIDGNTGIIESVRLQLFITNPAITSSGNSWMYINVKIVNSITGIHFIVGGTNPIASVILGGAFFSNLDNCIGIDNEAAESLRIFGWNCETDADNVTGIFVNMANSKMTAIGLRFEGVPGSPMVNGIEFAAGMGTLDTIFALDFINVTNYVVNPPLDARFPTVNIPLIQGTTFISAADNPWGWEIDAGGEFAIALGWLPYELLRVVRIRIIAVGLVAPGANNAMRLEITGEGGTFDEVYTTESIDVADHPSEEENFGVNDVIQWIIDASDDSDIGDLRGGDKLQIKVLHEAAGGGDIETDAIFSSVEVEYF